MKHKQLLHVNAIYDLETALLPFKDQYGNYPDFKLILVDRTSNQYLLIIY